MTWLQVERTPWFSFQVHYLHFAIILAVAVFLVQFWVSLMTKPRPPKKVKQFLLNIFANFYFTSLFWKLKITVSGICVQLRRVTYWTRNTPELPELTESEDEPEEEKEVSDDEYEIPSGISWSAESLNIYARNFP